MKLTRRKFLSASAAASAAPFAAPVIKTASTPTAKRVLTLVYDKSLGMMRAVDRVIR